MESKNIGYQIEGVSFGYQGEFARDKEELKLSKFLGELHTQRRNFFREIGFMINVYKNYTTNILTVELRTNGDRNGNNICVDFQSINEVIQFIENIVLNAEKHLVEGKKTEITSVASEEKNIKLYYNYIDEYMDKPEIFPVIESDVPELHDDMNKLVDKYEKDTCLYSGLRGCKPQDIIEIIEFEKEQLSEETIIRYEEYLKKYELYKKNDGAHKLSTTKEIMINGERLKSTEELIKYFRDISTEISGEKEIIDLSKRNISFFEQDRVLKSLYGEIPQIPEDDIRILSEYKLNPDEYVEILRGSKIPIDLSERVDSILKLDEIFKKFPELPENVRVYRVGKGVGKSRNDGDKVLYSQVISTSTSTEIKEIFSGEIFYQRDLEKGSKALPLDLILPLFNVGKAAGISENELFLLPCTYEVHNLSENVVEMRNAKEINIDELLEMRLEEMKNKLQNKGEHRHELLEQAKKDNVYDNPSIKQEKLEDLFNEIEESGKLEVLKEQDKKIKKDNLQYDSNVHGKNHTRKVNFFALAIAQKIGLTERDTEILLTAVQNHDIGRKNDYEDTEHGSNSVKRIIKEDKGRFENYTEEEVELIEFIISEHSKPSNENKRDLEENVPEDKRQRYKLLLDCMKDADKLDRVRIGDLDPSRLSLKESKTLVSAAYEANKYLPSILDTYDDEQLLQVESELEKVKRHKEQKFEKYEIKKDKENEKIEDESDFIRKKFMAESEKKGILSKIVQSYHKLRNKIQVIMKGIREDGR